MIKTHSICKGCKEEKPLSDFRCYHRKDRGNALIVPPLCKDCERKKRGVVKRTEKDRMNDRKKYSLSKKHYDVLQKRIDAKEEMIAKLEKEISELSEEMERIEEQWKKNIV
jgi:septal ring factor EnvC (AmiA/AmiB activator)